MAKFHGMIGYAETVDRGDGIHEEQFTERKCSGDLLQNSRRLDSSDKVNDDISIANEISILANPYAVQNFHSMRYAEFMGTKWKIISVRVSYPRLILTLGGVWNA